MKLTENPQLLVRKTLDFILENPEYYSIETAIHNGYSHDWAGFCHILGCGLSIEDKYPNAIEAETAPLICSEIERLTAIPSNVLDKTFFHGTATIPMIRLYTRVFCDPIESIDLTSLGQCDYNCCLLIMARPDITPEVAEMILKRPYERYSIESLKKVHDRSR